MEAIPQSFMRDPIFRKLGDVAQYAALSENDRKAYDASLRTYRDTYAIMQTERALGVKEGEAKGFAKGRAGGHAEGLLEGEAKGELQGIVRVALSMKLKVKDFDEISEFTGLTPEEIAGL